MVDDFGLPLPRYLQFSLETQIIIFYETSGKQILEAKGSQRVNCREAVRVQRTSNNRNGRSWLHVSRLGHGTQQRFQFRVLPRVSGKRAPVVFPLDEQTMVKLPFRSRSCPLPGTFVLLFPPSFSPSAMPCFILLNFYGKNIRGNLLAAFKRETSIYSVGLLLSV